MDGLKVNIDTRTITVNDQSPKLLINGRPQETVRLIDISPEDITRIEYQNYDDIRYGSPVINVIMRRPPQGGSVSAYLQMPATTRKAFARSSASYNYKKSEFRLDYSFIWRASTKEQTSSSEQFTSPDLQIERLRTGQPSHTRDSEHMITADYTLMLSPTTMLAATAGTSFHRNTYAQRATVAETRNGTAISDYDNIMHRHSNQTPFNSNIYFRTAPAKGHSLEAIFYANRNTGNYERQNDYSTGYQSSSDNHNFSSSIGANLAYAMPIRKCDLSFGASYSRSHARNTFPQNTDQSNATSNFTNALNAYANTGWRHRGFSIMASAGINWRDIHGTGLASEHYTNIRGSINISQQLGKSTSIRYGFSISPSSPSMTQSNNVWQEIDDVTVQVGGQNLKSSLSHSHNIQANWRHKRFRMYANVGFSSTSSQILPVWWFNDTPGSPYQGWFVKQTCNGDYYRTLSARLQASLSNLWGILSISAYGGLRHVWVKAPALQANRGRGELGMDINFYYKRWSGSLSYAPIMAYQFYGDSFTINNPYNGVSLMYNLNHWQFGISYRNPFTSKANRIRNYSLSKVHRTVSEYHIGDFNNLVLLSVQYRANFGTSFKKANRSLRSSNRTETGIATEY